MNFAKWVPVSIQGQEAMFCEQCSKSYPKEKNIDCQKWNFCPNCGYKLIFEKVCSCYVPEYSRCNGTRECDIVSCDGDRRKCIYPEVREREGNL